MGDDARSRWDAILRADSQTPAEQERVDAAVDLAEATLHAAIVAVGGTDTVRDVLVGGDAWSRIALMWHQVLTDTDAFARSRSSDATTCHIDRDAVRAWLRSPQPDADTTVADALRIGDDFDIYGFDKWVRISTLLDAAQRAGVFGVPDHTIGVLHLAGDHGFVDRHRITLTTPQHGAMCSGDIDTAELMTEHLAGVDAAVNVLVCAAQEATQLLYQRALIADVAWPTPNESRDPVAHTDSNNLSVPVAGKAFAALRLDAPAALAPVAAPTSSSVDRRHR
jgi:hypothetical protein